MPLLNQKEILIAVAGNPNSGKSTLVNAICGSKLHTGNWPGVTVEKKEAFLNYEGKKLHFIDLPGTYSLSPFSQDELIARDFLTKEKPDLILQVIDSTNLERHFFLTIQLLELKIPLILALNMYDEAKEKGINIKIDTIKQNLGVIALPTIASKNIGIKELLDTIINTDLNSIPKDLSYGDDINHSFNILKSHILKQNPDLLKKYPEKWILLKLLEKDEEVLKECKTSNFEEIIDKAALHFRKAHNNAAEYISDVRFSLANGLSKIVQTFTPIPKQDKTDLIDKFILNKYFGIPIFFAAMWLMFKLTFDIANPFVNWLDAFTSGPLSYFISTLLLNLHSPEWLRSLAVDGIISGVGAVLVFTPIIFFMMLFITLLEASGYLARAAFLMDNTMHKMGLHGKSFIPLVLGFGCNVPSVYATRIIESPRDKILTAMISPLISCSARLPVYVLFASAFFPNYSGTVIWSMYVIGILAAFLVSFILSKTLFKGPSPEFIMELPPYRIPGIKNILVHTWEKVKHFLVKAGSYILAMSIIIWFLFHFPLNKKDISESYFAEGAKIISPVFKPLGFGNWQASSSLLSGIVAKEVIVSTMSEVYNNNQNINSKYKSNKKIYNFSEGMNIFFIGFFKAGYKALRNVFSSFGVSGISTSEDKSVSSLKNNLHYVFKPLSALSFMVFVLLYMPCIVVIAAMRHEFGTWKWPLYMLSYQLVLAWLVSFGIYQIGSLLGLGL